MKQIVLKKAVFLGLLLLFGTKAFSQQGAGDLLKPISPLTPNAASIWKFGAMPVSLYTGIPNIQIPLYEIVVKDFKLPISLSYHASGIKVEDISSWVGMGWTLNAGGAVNRMQRGIEDEYTIDHKSSHINDINTILSNSGDLYLAWNNLQRDNYDTQSDIFSFSCGNESGKFFLDADNVNYSMPADKYTIVNEGRYTAYQNKNFFERWSITNKEGITFIFGKTKDNLNYYEISASTLNDPSTKTVSTWYLNEIILPSKDSINFKYDSYSFDITHIPGETACFNSTGLVTTTTYSKFYQALRLSEITFPQGRIAFVPGSTRQDLVADKVLDCINIYQKNGSSETLYKSFKFSTNNPIGNFTSDDLNFRLRLDSIKEISPTGEKGEVYKFNYYHDGYGLPARDSKNQDLWGYFNGANNSTLTPPCFMLWNGSVREISTGADRSVNSDLSKYGTLTKITYPTGGYTTFDYENNVARGLASTAGDGLDNVTGILSTLHNIPESQQGAWAQVTNTNGNDVGYSDPFMILSEDNTQTSKTITVSSSFMDDRKCDYTNTGSGMIWSCAHIDIEVQNVSSWSTYIAGAHINQTYQLQCGGTYRVKVTYDNANGIIGALLRAGCTWTGISASSVINPQIVDPALEKMVGGLRIKRISDYDPVSQKTSIRKYSYNYTPNDGYNYSSSGVIQNLPIYIYCTPTSPQSLYISSITGSPLFQTNGGYIGYKKVTVAYGENAENGQEIHFFKSCEDYPDEGLAASHRTPFPPSVSFDWRRGLPEQTQYFKYPDLYTPFKSTLNTYQFNTTGENSKVLTNILTNGVLAYCITYQTKTESFYLNTSTTTETNTNGNILTQTSYEQSPKNLEVSSSTLKNSDNKQATTYSTRASDVYNSAIICTDAASLGIKNLITNNIISAPVESYTVKTMADGTKYVTGGTLTTYYQDKPVPDKIYSLELTTPVLLSTVTPCYINSSGVFVKDTRYKLKVLFDNYDSKQNLTEQHKDGGVHSAYIWGYYSQYPVAKIVGSDYATVTGIITNQSLLDNPTDDNTLRNYLNILRSSLPNAQVTIYTYNPLVGMTSQTDPKGMTTYYEYDSFQRLKSIKDMNGNIVKGYDYHYKQ
jgi:YD repeat-containing protein